MYLSEKQSPLHKQVNLKLFPSSAPIFISPHPTTCYVAGDLVNILQMVRQVDLTFCLDDVVWFCF